MMAELSSGLQTSCLGMFQLPGSWILLYSNAISQDLRTNQVTPGTSRGVTGLSSSFPKHRTAGLKPEVRLHTPKGSDLQLAKIAIKMSGLYFDGTH